MVRYAVPEDATAIADAHVSGWQVAYRGMIPDEYLDNMDRVARALFWRERLEGGHQMVVSESDGVVVGFSDYGAARHDSDWAELYAIYVHPVFWGAGHGRDLMLATEENLAGLGYQQALLWVLDQNQRARTFYERHGWTVSDQTTDDTIGGVKVTEVRYERDL